MNKANFMVLKMQPNHENFSVNGGDYYVSLAPKGVMTLQRLCEIIADKTSQNASDLYAMIYSVSRESLAWLENGYVVDWGPLGSFVQRVRSRVPISDPKKVDSSQVCFSRVHYTPENSFRKRLARTEFCRVRRKMVPEFYTPEQRRENILRRLETDNGITLRQCRALNHVAHVTAWRDMNTLIEQGLVRRLGNGYAVIYVAASEASR